MSKFGIDITYGLMKGLGKLPLKFHHGFGRFLSWFASSVLQYRKGVVYVNLARAFPDKNNRELEQIANDFYRHFGEVFAEAVWFAGATPKRLRKQKICRLTNPEVLAEAWKNSPSVMMLTSHCGNWELIGGIRSYNERPELDEVFDERHISIAYKQQSSKVWDEVLKKTRSSPVDHYQGLVETRQILRHVMEHRNEKRMYIFIADQRPYQTPVEVGEFMHQHTYGMVGGMKLAHKLKMAVVYLKMVRKAPGKYEMTFVPLAADASQCEPEELMKTYFHELEKEINETPANYLWSHKRWN